MVLKGHALPAVGILEGNGMHVGQAFSTGWILDDSYDTFVDMIYVDQRKRLPPCKFVKK